MSSPSAAAASAFPQAASPTKRRQIDIETCLASKEHIPAIIELNRKSIVEGTLQTPVNQELLEKIIGFKEAVVATLKGGFEHGKVVAYNLRRTLTVPENCAEKEPLLWKQVQIADRLTKAQGTATFGKKFSLGSQTVVAEEARGSNVQREIILATAYNIVAVHDQSFSIAAIAKTNERSLKVATEKDGSKVIDEDDKMWYLLSIDLEEAFNKYKRGIYVKIGLVSLAVVSVVTAGYFWWKNKNKNAGAK